MNKSDISRLISFINDTISVARENGYVIDRITNNDDYVESVFMHRIGFTRKTTRKSYVEIIDSNVDTRILATLVVNEILPSAEGIQNGSPIIRRL